MENRSNIFFAGKAEKVLDKKGRVHIPALFANQVPEKVFHITRGPDQSLFVFPKEVFVGMAHKINKHFGSRGEKDKDKRVYFLETLADAPPVQCDGQGRISIPQEFLNYAKIKDKILITGGFDKLIFWNPDIYIKLLESSSMTAQERVQEFSWADTDYDGNAS